MLDNHKTSFGFAGAKVRFVNGMRKQILEKYIKTYKKVRLSHYSYRFPVR